MSGNIFTKPTERFKQSLEEPSPIKVAIIILITALILGGLAFLITSNIINAGLAFLFGIIQWFVLAIIFWVFEFMFTPKKKHMISSNFFGVAAALAELWILFTLALIFFILALAGGIIAAISGVIIFVLSLLFVVYSFILMKTILDTGKGRAFIAWILAMIVYTLLMTISSTITMLII